jgi:hypothetical protein
MPTTDATVTPIKRPSRASRATARNDQAAAPKPTTPTAPKVATPVEIATTTPARPRQSRASRAAAKLAETPVTATTAPPTIEPAPAAEPVTVAAVKKPTRTGQNRQIAAAMAVAVADMLAVWDSAETGIPREQAAAACASWLNYAPIAVDGWDDRLPERSGAGGRGAKNRKSA